VLACVFESTLRLALRSAVGRLVKDEFYGKEIRRERSSELPVISQKSRQCRRNSTLR
jgi:hypothetical protein